MRVLLDECLPRRLKSDFPSHTVATVPEMGWAGTKNGELLRLAASHFDALVTIDQGITFQQNLTILLGGSGLGIVLLQASSNRLDAIRPLVPALLEALRGLQPGDVLRIGAGDQATEARG